MHWYGYVFLALYLFLFGTCAWGLWGRSGYLRKLREYERAMILWRGFCPSCGYDLRATPDRCPECGQDVRMGTD
jgi:hypothetical protein